MRIAILSWGSLIRTGEARGLAINGEWNAAGPVLPIEFSRISQSGDRTGCLTLVIDEQNGVNTPTFYAVSSHNNLDWALSNLRFIENITLKYSVGYINLINHTERGWAREKTPISCDIITEWARRNSFDAVIWTSLLSNFEKALNIPFTVQSAVSYINSLSPQLKAKAMQYVNNSPATVVTPVRTALSNPLPLSDSPIIECAGEESLMRFVNRFRRQRTLHPTA